jgi:hypothetical protein
MPVQLLPFGAAMAAVFIWPRLRLPTSSARLVAEAAAITTAVILTEWGLWALYWLLEQNW